MQTLGYNVSTADTFDTLSVNGSAEQIMSLQKYAAEKQVNFWYPSKTTVQFSIDETTTEAELHLLAEIFALGKKTSVDVVASAPAASLSRTSAYMTHPVFHRYHSETEMLRYIFKLQNDSDGKQDGSYKALSARALLAPQPSWFPI